MTSDLNDYYGVTVHHAERVAPKRWVAQAEAFRRDTFAIVARFVGEGATRSAADDHALRVGRQRFGARGAPPDWGTRA